jgi:hypothetical protein
MSHALIQNSLFKEDCPDNLNYNDVTVEDIFKYCSEEPFMFFAKNYEETVKNIKAYDGFKVRVPYTGPNQMIELSKTLPFFFDNVVFSPAPNLPPSKEKKESPWPEFSSSSFSMYDINIVSISDIRSLLVLKPLIDKGQVTFLPHYGESLHRGLYQNIWIYPDLNFPSLNPHLIGEPYIETVAESALISLFTDNVVSDQLSCIHLLPSSCVDRIGINGIPNLNSTLNKIPSHAFLKLKLPYIENLTHEEISKLKEEEYEHFKSFSEGIRLALLEINDEVEYNSKMDFQIAKIQRDLIDEPLKELESSLARLTKYQKYRMAGYTLASFSMVLASTLNNEALKIATSAIGAVSILEVLKDFIDYLEKKSQLKDDSIYFLLKAKRLADRKGIV